MKKMTQDTGSNNKSPNQGKKLSINMEESDILKYAKSFFNWRGMVGMSKIDNLNPSDYDKLIEFLYKKPENIRENTKLRNRIRIIVERMLKERR